MDDDARITRLLRDAVIDADDLESAREEIQQRIVVARRRSYVIRGAGLAAAAAAVLAIVVIVEPSGLEVPVIGEGPQPGGAVRVSTACGEVEVDPAVAEYLERWTEGRADGFADCVLAAVPGPEPRFDTSTLGTEQRWLSEAPDDITVPGPPMVQELAEGYPFVFIGTHPTHATSTGSDQTTLLRWWQSPSTDVIWWCAGKVPDGGAGCGTGAPGEYGMGWMDDGPVDIDMLVPDPTAVAVLSVGDQPVAWQRPRGRTVLFVHDNRTEGYTVTTYDADGHVIDETTIQQ